MCLEGCDGTGGPCILGDTRETPTPVPDTHLVVTTASVSDDNDEVTLEFESEVSRPKYKTKYFYASTVLDWDDYIQGADIYIQLDV